MEKRIVSSRIDIDYVRAHFRAIENPDPELPAPSYYDTEGRAYVPLDYESQERDRERFAERAAREIERLGAPYDREWIAAAWDGYWAGVYGMCLKHATPENIVRKNRLIDGIAALIWTPRPGNEEWLACLREKVDALDALEQPFTDFDRVYFGRPVSRETYVTAVRDQFLTAVPQRAGVLPIPRRGQAFRFAQSSRDRSP